MALLRGTIPETPSAAEPAAFGEVYRRASCTVSMGFDKNDPHPVVNPAKRTTKVNIAIVIGVVLFFVVAGIVVWSLWADPSRAT